MRILVISGAYPPFVAPESAHTRFLCRELAARGQDVHLLTSSEIPAAPSSEFSIHRSVTGWNWRNLPRIVRCVWRLKPDVILLIYIDWIYRAHSLMRLLPGILRKLAPKVRLVTLLENESGLAGGEPARPATYHFVKRLVGLFVNGEADPVYGTLLRDSWRLIVLSERHLEAFERVHPGVRERMTVIGAPSLLKVDEQASVKDKVREPELPKHSQNDANTVRISFFGYVYPGKGLETLLEAMAALKTTESNLKFGLTIIGGTNADLERELKVKAQALDLAEEVVWLGFQEDEPASRVLQATDIVVLPFDVGLRLNNSSFATCASHGLPIISTRGAKLESAFQDRVNVLLCPPKDPEALAAAIREVSVSPELRRRLAEGALRTAASVFSPAAVIDATLRVLNDKEGEIPQALGMNCGTAISLEGARG